MRVLIAGGGQTLYFLCRTFIAKGYDVVVVNRDEGECVRLARRLPVKVVCGDASNSQILEDAGAMGADAVLAISPHDQDNLVICQIAALHFNVPRVVALANDPENTEIFEKLGISAFSTTEVIASLIEQRATLEHVLNLVPIGEGRVNVTEVVLDTNSPVAGKLLRDIEVPSKALVAVVIRDGRPIVPRGANDLRVNDRVVLVTLPENHGRVLKLFTGEGR
jgi:trk system potassium uptake protein TrkA